MRRFEIVLILFVLLACQKPTLNVVVDTQQEWQHWTDSSSATVVLREPTNGDRFDLMGNGGLILQKFQVESLFTRTSAFKSEGRWLSKWLPANDFTTVEIDYIVYGNPLDLKTGWHKAAANPLFSGSNELLPLDEKNLSPKTIVLPEPGGVPQDPSLIKGSGKWQGKWLLIFNHTPRKWPFEYYWSFALADSLAPLQRGENPFRLPEDHYPLFGPVDSLAPNDWLEVNDHFYAPGETYQNTPHLWISDDFVHWQLAGTIKELVGTDPGICFDGEKIHLFSENHHLLMHAELDVKNLRAIKNESVLDVHDHTGDADCIFFNNQWHLFFDDGPHLHYRLGHAVTSADGFPYKWKLENDFFGPHNPEQGQRWDDDDEQGNRFGTGDADLALEDLTLYMVYERPIGIAYRTLTEVFDDRDQSVQIRFWYDNNGDGQADAKSSWQALRAGKVKLPLPGRKAKQLRIELRLKSSQKAESPLLRSLKLL